MRWKGREPEKNTHKIYRAGELTRVKIPREIRDRFTLHSSSRTL